MNKKFQDFAEKVTAEIIEELRKGNVIWQKSWNNGGAAGNYATGRPYEGFNQLYLSFKAERNNYPTAFYLSFKQAQALGGYVRKGEHATMIIYWKIGTYKTGKRVSDGSGSEKDEAKTVFTPFFHFVFNIAQIDGITFKVQEPAGKANQPLKVCEEIITSMPMCPVIRHGGNRAYYVPSADYIQMPKLDQFFGSEEYYCTLFHEAIHSTGHAKRLNRFSDSSRIGKFGDEEYSKEELIAEMGAVYLSSYAGISTQHLRKNSAAYLNGWMKALKDDATLLITAANRAQKATAFILALAEGEEAQEGQENNPMHHHTAAA